MKRVVVGVMAGLCLIAIAACGGGDIEQPAACRDYITCYENTGGRQGVLNSTYGPMGSCWRTGVAATAESCTESCRLSLEKARMTFPDAGC